MLSENKNFSKRFYKMSLSKHNEKLCCFEMPVAVCKKDFGLSCENA